MPSTRRPFPSGPVPPLVLLLLGTLGLSGVLAYQAQDAVRSHRAASEGALRDYAAFASWELGRRIESDLQRLLTGTLLRARLVAGSDGEPWARAAARFQAGFAPSPTAGRSSVEEECGCPGAIHDLFAVNLRTRELTLSEPRLLAARRDWLVAALSARASVRSRLPPLPLSMQLREARAPAPDGGGRAVRQVLRVHAALDHLPVPGEDSAMVIFSVVRDAEERPVEVYGFVVSVGAVASAAVRRVVAGSPLLPPSLTRGMRNDDILAMSVGVVGGREVFRSGGAFTAVTVADTVATSIGALATAISVRPDVAERLVIGGLPRSRLPLLIGVLALTLGLTVIALAQLRRQQELVRLRSDFVAGVSHELRTPLAQIRLFSELLASGRLGERQRERSLQIIGEESRRLTYLVENVLRFSHAERRPGRIRREPTDVGGLMSEVAEAFGPLARARGVTLELATEDGVRAALDRDAVRQVLLNLLDNAVKYGPPGQRVRMGMAHGGAEVRLWVDDQGPGVPMEERARIWQPYVRLERDVEASTGGSGIGLTVVQELVELHGGRVVVEDAPGAGARFLVRLPAHPPTRTTRKDSMDDRVAVG